MLIRPILSTLRHHKLTAILLALQVAFTCAIVSNAVFLILRRVERVSVPSGLAESRVSLVTVNDLEAGENPLSLHLEDLRDLRGLPGVQSATLVSNLPLSGSEDTSGACRSIKAIHAAMAAHSMHVPGCADVDEYWGGTDVLQTLGLKLVDGHDFHADDYRQAPTDYVIKSAPAAIVSLALAKHLYPSADGHVVGRTVYFMPHAPATRIVGVVAHLQRGKLRRGVGQDFSVLLPLEPSHALVTFALRSKPRDRQHVLREAVALLKKNHPDREISADGARTYARVRDDYFSRDTSLIGMLLAAACGLLFVTALGISGLASFWVGQRRRTIGIRRAVGATRREVLEYFLVENFLIVGAGVILGMALAVLLSLWLMHHYELPRLPWLYLPTGAAVLWLLGQLSALGPALRAARVPPVVATRSV